MNNRSGRREARAYRWSSRSGALLALLPVLAWAGPPFQTDDPEPVDLGHYEFYVFSAVDRTPRETDPTSPAFEFNWGALPDTQLHAVLALGGVLPAHGSGPTASPRTYGLLDTEIGVKYRLVHQGRNLPEIGVFPMIELPTGDSSRGLGVGRTWYKLPLWIQKDWGPWTTYGGGGYQVVHQFGYRSFPYVGWLLQRDVGQNWTLGAEAFHHGAEGAGTPLDRSTTLIDFGGYYYFRKPAFQLLYSVGHAVAGSSETYAYLGLYWTWGGEAGRDAADDRAAAVGWSQIPLNGTRRAR